MNRVVEKIGPTGLVDVMLGRYAPFNSHDMDALIGDVLRQRNRRNDAIVRDLLGRWVSGLEPAVALDRDGNVLGLIPADTPVGVKPWMLKV